LELIRYLELDVSLAMLVNLSMKLECKNAIPVAWDIFLILLEVHIAHAALLDQYPRILVLPAALYVVLELIRDIIQVGFVTHVQKANILIRVEALLARPVHLEDMQILWEVPIVAIGSTCFPNYPSEPAPQSANYYYAYWVPVVVCFFVGWIVRIFVYSWCRNRMQQNRPAVYQYQPIPANLPYPQPGYQPSVPNPQVQQLTPTAP
jgi:hypothetical protein